MKKIDLGQAITILANVGVIAGIAFLAVELRQNNEMMRAQTRGELSRDSVDQIRLNVNDPIFADVLLRGDRGEELSEVEQSQYGRYRAAWWWHWQDMVYQHGMGLYDDAELALQIGVIRRDMDRFPGIKSAWCETRPWTSPELIEAVEGADRETYC